jgi:peptidoglycan lytic transglycosylase
MISRRIAFIILPILLAACSAPRTVERPDLPPSRRPYTVNGERYEPLATHEGYWEEGLASWYGEEWHGRRTSSGEPYDMDAMTAAHKTLPLGVSVKVRNRRTGREAIVRINDRGPFVRDRIIDLSRAAARELGSEEKGIIPVSVVALGYLSRGPGGEVSYAPLSDYGVGTFAVQVASFGRADNARRLASELRGIHGAAAIQEATVNGTPYYRVQAGRYGSLREADEARGMFAAAGYPGCFVVAIDEKTANREK